MTDFNLFDLIREELATNASADLTVVAEHVLKQIQPKQYKEALEQALPRLLQTANSAGRPSGRLSRGGANPSRWEGPEGHGAMHDAWMKLMAQREKSDGIDVFLGDMTKAQVLAAAETRRQVAVANAKMHDRFRALADLVPDKGCVRDIPMEQAMAVFS